MADVAPDTATTLTRVQLRQALANLSVQKGEQIHFLSEAAVLLEVALMEAGNPQQRDDIAAQLGSVYLQFYLVTHEARYLTVTGHILRPLSASAHAGILLGLVRLAALKQEPALLRHWVTRLSASPQFDWDLLDMPELAHVPTLPWFQALRQPQLH